MTIEIIINWVAKICSIAMATYGVYYLLIALNSFRKKKPYPEAKKIHKFAIFIAARNEENVIGQLIDSLKEQNYPKDKYDIVVMPNNCTDNTKEVALKHGADIFEPVHPIKNKGQVLHQTFKEYLENHDHDAYLVFDADNIVDPNYLKEMNKALDAGYQAAIGFRDSKNPTSSYMSGSYTIYYLIISTFYNRARSNIGMNAMITGTGFMTSRENMLKIGGWNTQSITEDIEFTTQNSVTGTHIEFVPNAITYDEQPESFMQSWHQRLRWSKGSIQNFKLMKSELFKASFNGKGKNSLDMLIMLIAAHMQIFGFFAGAVGLVAAFLLDISVIKYIISITVGGALLQALVSILVLAMNKKPILKMWKGILHFWWFTLTWLPIQVVALYKEDIEWKEIKHKAVTES